MKKLLMAIATITTIALGANAEGYQVNTLSARQNGMGHTGVAQKLGAESMIFNPAGLAWMDHQLDISGALTATMATCSAELDGKKYETDNTPATPISVNVGMKVYDNFSVGISFYTPYGSKINWTDNWPGAELSQRVKLTMYTVQPTFAWRPIPNLSIGAGFMMTWATADLNKGLIGASSMDMVLGQMGSPFKFGNTTPASVNLTGKAQMAYGANIGIMWEINKKWTIGAQWRSQQTLKLRSGIARVTYANEVAQQILQSQLGLINEANFAAAMPAPWVLTVGATFKPIPRLLLAFDAQLTGWHAYQALNIDFLSEQLTAFDQHIVKDYKSSMTYKLGAQFSLTHRFDIRAGLMIDTTPVNDQYYNPETRA